MVIAVIWCGPLPMPGSQVGQFLFWGSYQFAVSCGSRYSIFRRVFFVGVVNRALQECKAQVMMTCRYPLSAEDEIQLSTWIRLVELRLVK